MPLTVSNFMDLADIGFYDGTHFHSVTPDALEFGCPISRNPANPRFGKGGPDANTEFLDARGTGRVFRRNERGTIELETTEQLGNEPGTLAFRKGSHMVVNVERNAQRNWFKENTVVPPTIVFGKVIQGIEVLQEIGHVETAQGNRGPQPVEPVMVIRVIIFHRKQFLAAHQPHDPLVRYFKRVWTPLGEKNIYDEPEDLFTPPPPPPPEPPRQDVVATEMDWVQSQIKQCKATLNAGVPTPAFLEQLRDWCAHQGAPNPDPNTVQYCTEIYLDWLQGRSITLMDQEHQQVVDLSTLTPSLLMDVEQLQKTLEYRAQLIETLRQQKQRLQEPRVLHRGGNALMASNDLPYRVDELHRVVVQNPLRGGGRDMRMEGLDHANRMLVVAQQG